MAFILTLPLPPPWRCRLMLSCRSSGAGGALREVLGRKGCWGAARDGLLFPGAAGSSEARPALRTRFLSKWWGRGEPRGSPPVPGLHRRLHRRTANADCATRGPFVPPGLGAKRVPFSPARSRAPWLRVPGIAVLPGTDSCPTIPLPVRSLSVGRRHRNGDSCQPLRADHRLQIYYRSSASAKAHQARGRDAPGGDERIPSLEFMWNKLSTGDISS